MSRHLLSSLFMVLLAMLAPSIASAESLTTTLGGTNSFNGNMFEIVAREDRTIDTFDVNIATRSQTIEIYYR
ncbi:unnamed protein product, partial [Laminaria digitata]